MQSDAQLLVCERTTGRLYSRTQNKCEQSPGKHSYWPWASAADRPWSEKSFSYWSFFHECQLLQGNLHRPRMRACWLRVQASLELFIWSWPWTFCRLLLQAKCWDYRHVLPCTSRSVYKVCMDSFPYSCHFTITYEFFQSFLLVNIGFKPGYDCLNLIILILFPNTGIFFLIDLFLHSILLVMFFKSLN